MVLSAAVVTLWGCGSEEKPSQSPAPVAVAAAAEMARPVVAPPQFDQRLFGKWRGHSGGTNFLRESSSEVIVQFTDSYGGVSGLFVNLEERCRFTKPDGSVHTASAEVTTMAQVTSATHFSIAPEAMQQSPLVVLQGNQEYCVALLGGGSHRIEFIDDNTIYESYLMMQFTRVEE